MSSANGKELDRIRTVGAMRGFLFRRYAITPVMGITVRDLVSSTSGTFGAELSLTMFYLGTPGIMIFLYLLGISSGRRHHMHLEHMVGQQHLVTMSLGEHARRSTVAI